MLIRVDYLIYFYLLLCVCLLAFNLAYLWRNKWTELRSPKRIAYWQKTLLDGKKRSKREIRRLARRLSRVVHLTAFHEAAQGLLQEETSAGAVRQWMEDNRLLFMELAYLYVEKSTMEKAFFAYIISCYAAAGGRMPEPVANILLRLTWEPSVYCRENALHALYRTGDLGRVLRAFLLMERHGITHTRKLVTDGLLQFQGDRAALAEALWESRDEFGTEYQVAFMDFIRMVDGGFCERFLALLDSDADREAKFAALRYFRKYRYLPAEERLCAYVENWNADDWEFAAISASSLENYPGQRSAKALLCGIKSEIWDIRNNSADALLKLTGQDRALLDWIDDGYGREILQYKIDSLETRSAIAKEREVVQVGSAYGRG